MVQAASLAQIRARLAHPLTDIAIRRAFTAWREAVQVAAGSKTADQVFWVNRLRNAQRILEEWRAGIQVLHPKSFTLNRNPTSYILHPKP